MYLVSPPTKRPAIYKKNNLLLKIYFRNKQMWLHCICIVYILQIALQIPDELMQYSVSIAEKIQSRVTGQVFILGDTSYGR